MSTEDHCIGICSLCGGEVMGHRGLWMSVLPPPPPKCSKCGAHPEGSVRRVIQMEPSAATPLLLAWFAEEARAPSLGGMPMPDGKWRA